MFVKIVSHVGSLAICVAKLATIKTRPALELLRNRNRCEEAGNKRKCPVRRNLIRLVISLTHDDFLPCVTPAVVSTPHTTAVHHILGLNQGVPRQIFMLIFL